MALSASLQVNIIEKNYDRQLETFTKLPTVKRSIDAFTQAAPKIETPEQLLSDRRSLEVVLSAFQLESQINSTALIRKVLTEPPGEADSLVNKLADPRYRTLADALKGLQDGTKPFSDPAEIAKILDRFKANEFEKDAGQDAPGVREALYFKRNIGNVTKLSQLMADRTMLEVARVSLGLPESVGLLDFDAQVKRYEKEIDVEEFKDPAFVEKFVQRYTILLELENPPTNPLLSLITPISQDRPFNIPGTINLIV